RLSGTVGADQRDNLAGGHRYRHVVQNLHAPVPGVDAIEDKRHDALPLVSWLPSSTAVVPPVGRPAVPAVRRANLLPRYASITRSSESTVVGFPLVSTSPWCRTSISS